MLGVPAAFYKEYESLTALTEGLGHNEIAIEAGKYISALCSQVFSLPHSCSSIQDTTNTVVTIPPSFFGGGNGGRCSILIVGQNTGTPSIFVLGRKRVGGTIYQGEHITASDLSFNADGSLSVTKANGLSLYFRVIVMEW